jgi:hypothetical protein
MTWAMCGGSPFRTASVMKVVVGGDERDRPVACADAADDRGEHLPELRRDQQQALGVGLGRGDLQQRDKLAGAGQPVLHQAVVGQLCQLLDPDAGRAQHFHHGERPERVLFFLAQVAALAVGRVVSPDLARRALLTAERTRRTLAFARILRSRTLFDARRQQIDHLSDAGGTHVRSAARRIDPAQVGLAVELRQGIEECARLGAGRERRGDIVGKISALRTFRGQFNGHLAADRHTQSQQALRCQGQHPSAVGRQEPGPDPVAVDRAGNGMVSLSAPRLIRVERHRDYGIVARTGGNERAETLCAHDPIVARQRPAEPADRGERVS